MTLLRDVMEIPERVHAGDFVLKLTEGVEHADETIRSYVVTPAIARAFDQALGIIERAVVSGRSQAAFLHGSFGSGKSHFMAVLHAVLGGNPTARGITELRDTIGKHDPVLQGRRVLRLAYHLIGAESLEQALFGQYLQQIRRLHPDAPLPALHRTDGLLRDAEGLRQRFGDEGFFAELNGAAAQDPWTRFAGTWTAERYDGAAAATPDDPERRKLVQALVGTFFPSFAQSTAFVDIDTGLRVMAEHARDLGYDAVVLFLDELILWLAGHISNQEWVSSEGGKVAKLVESADAIRPIPLISFIARQRDVRDFIGDAAPGAYQEAISDTFRWQEGRFDRITLGDENLPYVAAKRLLEPKDEHARQILNESFRQLDRRPEIWNTLLDGVNTDEGHRGADEDAFRRTYPFSPALISTLRALSSLMQRERTALKVMQHILVDQRDELKVEDLVPVGDAFDYVVEGEHALDAGIERRFSSARQLYHDKVRFLLLEEHHLNEEAAEAQGRLSPFRADDRLLKTLLLSSLTAIPALRGLDSYRLAALNHGTIATLLPGQEATTVLTKLRRWQPQLPEIQLSGDGANPTVSMHPAEVDYRGVLDRVHNEDSPGARRRLLKQMVWKGLGVNYDPNFFQMQEHSFIWRATRRTVEIRYGNVHDRTDVPDEALQNDGQQWRIIVDYPFDEDPRLGPLDDEARLERFLADVGPSRTAVWLPRFLAPQRLQDLGDLVLLEYLFSGGGTRFDAYADYLSATDRAQARGILERMRESLRARVKEVLLQAYGAAPRQPGDISSSPSRVLHSLDPAVRLQEPVGATLTGAFENLLDQLISQTYPVHPHFDPDDSELRPNQLRRVLEYVVRARQDPNGRVVVADAADRQLLRRVCNPLELGEMHENAYVLSLGSSFPWLNRFQRQMAIDGTDGPVKVSQLRRWLDADAPRGLTASVANLVIAAWALATDRIWYLYGSRVTPPPTLEQIREDMELREAQLPSSEEWDSATRRAATWLGMSVPPRLTAANLSSFGAAVRSEAERRLPAARALAQALSDHAHFLHLRPTTDRLLTARATLELLETLARTSDDVDLVGRLASGALPADDQVAARSMHRAEEVGQALSGASWTLLQALDRLDDERSEEASRILTQVRRAAAQEEFQVPLAEKLKEAVREATDLLARRLTPPPHPSPLLAPQPTPPPTSTPITPAASLHVTTGEVERAITALRDFAREHPGQSIEVTWHLDR